MRPTILTSEGFAIIVMLVAAGLLGFYSYIYYRETRQVRRLSRRQMLSLWGLRGLAAGLAVLALARPALTMVRSETRAPVVSVLFDVSQSMNYDEAFENELVPRGQRASRYQTAKKALDVILRPVEKQYAGLAKNHDVRLFKFSHDLQELAMISRGSKDVPDSGALFPRLPDGREDSATGDFTKIGASGLEALRRLGGEKLSGVILLSDGRQTNGTPIDELIKKLAAPGVEVPVHAVVFGSEHPPRDLSIDSVDCPTEASLGDVLTFAVKITNNIQDAQLEVPLTLYEASLADYEAAADEKALEKVFAQVTQRKLRLTRGTDTINMACIPETEGKRVFRFVLPKIKDEVNDRNNSFVVNVTVVKKQLNVLLIACEPNREYLYLVPALLRDPVINLSCYLQSADVDYIHQGNTNIEKPPQTEQDWNNFDVAVLMDVDPNKLTVQQVAGLEAMVAKGGGLLVVGGRVQGLAKMVGVHPAKIQQLLPVEIDRHAHPDHDVVFERSFAVARTRAGREHPVMRISGDERVNEMIWETFPRFYWSHPVRQAKPRVPVVLLEGEDGRCLMAVQRYQEGAVMYCGLDSMWLWRYPFESFDYDRFWSRSIRYLGESRLMGTQQQVALTTDRHVYAPGERAQLRLTILDPSLRSQLGDQTIRAEVINPNKVADPVTLRCPSPNDNVYTGRYHALRVGSMAVQVRHTGTDSERKVLFEATHRFEVRHESLEAKNPTADLSEMRRLADSTGGQYIDYKSMTESRLRELAGQLSTDPRVNTWDENRDLWDGFTFLLIFLVLVSTEWSMRKWWGLL